jgi:putative membrane protein insertion efficiency factor
MSTIRQRRAFVGRLGERCASAVLLGMVRTYQFALSPLLGRHCRFQPTCSDYFRQAIERYGAAAGAWRGLRRICRCHPWHPGGYDPP